MDSAATVAPPALAPLPPSPASTVPSSAPASQSFVPLPRPAARPTALPPRPSRLAHAASWLRWRPGACDLRAGWVSGLVMLPQAIAFAVLAGLPPEMGIYTSILPVIVAALLGPSAVLLSGPNTAVAVMIGVALVPLAAPASQEYLDDAVMLAAMVGIAQLGFALGGVARLLARLPRYTFAGLNMGIGVLMFSCQMAPALGLLASRETPSWYAPFVYAQRWAAVNPWAVAVAVVAIAAGLLFERWRKPWMPSLVAAMIAGALAGWGLDLALGLEATGLDRVGHLHMQLDIFTWPAFRADEFYVLKQLALSAVAIALVGALQSVIILQSTKPGADARDCRRELLAQAGCNLAASVCSGFACSGSFNRTAAHIDAGATTRAAAVLSSLFVLVLAVVATPALAWMPRAAIAGTLGLVGWGMLRSGWRQASREGGASRRAALFLALGVTLFGIEGGLAIALAMTLAGALLGSRAAAPAKAP